MRRGRGLLVLGMVMALVSLAGCGDDDADEGDDAAPPPDFELPEVVDLTAAETCADLATITADAVEAQVALLAEARYDDVPEQFDVSFDSPREPPEGPPQDFGEAVDQALFVSQEQRAAFVAVRDDLGCSDDDLEAFCTAVEALDPPRDSPAAVYATSFSQEHCGFGG